MVKYTDLLSLRNNPTEFQNGLQNYVYQNCSNPQKVKVFDSVIGTFVRREVPCGKCWHCCQVKQAEWVTRMFLHNEYWTHRYFVTLSYRPLYSSSNFEDAALESEFEETLPLYDSDNSTRSYGLHPCLLSRNHLRNYFKRLRKSLDIEISMFSVGEYGKKYSRPHYHLLIWSKSPISEEKIKEAWSKVYIKTEKGEIKPFRGQKNYVTKKRVYFGDVDVVDLNKPRFYSQHGNTQSDVFKYVAKYVNKYENYMKNEQNDAKNTKNTLFGVKSLRICKVFRNFAPEILKQRYYYEKKCIKKFTSQYAIDLSSAPAPIRHYSKCQFVRTFAPFSVCSTKNAIGKDFLFANLESLTQGRFNPPMPDGVNSRFPNYYSRKIRDIQSPIRFAKFTPSRTANGYTFSMGNQSNLFSLADIICNNPSVAACTYFDEHIRKAAKYGSKIADKEQLDVDVHLYNIQTKKHLIYDPLTNTFGEYIYRRKQLLCTGCYTPARTIGLQIQQGFAALQKKHAEFIYNYQREMDSKSILQKSIGNFDRLWLNAVETLDNNLRIHQQLYFYKRKKYAKNYE